MLRRVSGEDPIRRLYSSSAAASPGIVGEKVPNPVRMSDIVGEETVSPQTGQIYLVDTK